MRHAHASNPPGVDDFDRPLSDRGRGEANDAGAWLRERGIVPDRIVCSAARRTTETAERVAAAFDPPPPVDPRRDLYNADADALTAAVEESADGVTLLIAHNPGVTLAAAQRGGPGALVPAGLIVVRGGAVEAAWRPRQPSPSGDGAP